MNRHENDPAYQLGLALHHIEALLRVIDRHMLSWSWFPEDRDACDRARAFVREELSGR